MIRKLINRVLEKGSSTLKAVRGRKSRGVAGSGLRVIPFAEHRIAASRLSPCALKTAQTLQQAGFAAFIVGGAVRDLILGKEPKDFDVATDAEPEEVRALFRRSRIIGRRFRIVHVMCGQETVEVSTFRALQGGEEEGERHTDESGRILRDNVFGTQEEDAMRRDFTINALYYEPSKQEIWDYHHGYADLKAGVLKVIGDPVQRYREDPVRMLRAVRLAAKLGFRLDEAARRPIRELAPLLEQVPASRLFDEMLKLLLSGHAVQSIHQLRKEGLHHGLLPLLDVILEQPLGERFVMLALTKTDQRIEEDKPVSPAFLFAALLWHEVLAAWQQFQAEGARPIPALHQAMDRVLAVQEEKLAIPRRYDATMKEIWAMQPRFLQRSGQRPFRLLEQPRFRAGFDFLMMRCESGEVDREIGQWWEAFQAAEPEDRARMLVKAAEPRKRRRRKPKAAASTEGRLPAARGEA
jgi:poly(A) polymerase